MERRIAKWTARTNSTSYVKADAKLARDCSGVVLCYLAKLDLITLTRDERQAAEVVAAATAAASDGGETAVTDDDDNAAWTASAAADDEEGGGDDATADAATAAAAAAARKTAALGPNSKIRTWASRSIAAIRLVCLVQCLQVHGENAQIELVRAYVSGALSCASMRVMQLLLDKFPIAAHGANLRMIWNVEGDEVQLVGQNGEVMSIARWQRCVRTALAKFDRLSI